jgi:1,4-dihydroxy-2-naphthoyl-CoA synthase
MKATQSGPAKAGTAQADQPAADAADLALLSEVRGPVAVLTLNRPGRLNAIGREVLGQLAGAVARAAADDRVRALVIAGAGRAFSAGADLGEIEALPDARAFRGFVARMTEVYQMITDCPKPSVAPRASPRSASAGRPASPAAEASRSARPR